MDPLQSVLRRLSPDRVPDAERGLMAYADLLLRYNRTHNLVGRLSKAQIIEDLLLDSLLPALVTPPTGPLLDVGSGGGLPGVPLAVVFPEIEVHLVEPRQKRTTFLSIVKRRLGLSNVTVHRGRLEDFDALERGQIPTATSKAFRPPLDWLESIGPWLKDGGVAYLHGSETSWTVAETVKASDLGFETIGQATHPGREDRFGVALVLRRAG